MFKLPAATLLMLGVTNIVFAAPKAGDACTSDAQCQMQAHPGQATPVTTLKCNLTTKKCESLNSGAPTPGGGIGIGGGPTPPQQS